MRQAFWPAGDAAARRRQSRHRSQRGEHNKGENKKVRPRSDAATDGDRFGARDRDGGPDQTQAKPSDALLRSHDSRTYPQGRLRATGLILRACEAISDVIPGMNAIAFTPGMTVCFTAILRDAANRPMVRTVCDRRQIPNARRHRRKAASRCDWFRGCASTPANIRRALRVGTRRRSARGRRLCRGRLRW